MIDESIPDEWMTVAQAQRHLRKWFKTVAALKSHLGKRAVNGLETRDAVRLSPLRRLIVNPRRTAAWAVGDETHRAA